MSCSRALTSAERRRHPGGGFFTLHSSDLEGPVNLDFELPCDRVIQSLAATKCIVTDLKSSKGLGLVLIPTLPNQLAFPLTLMPIFINRLLHMSKTTNQGMCPVRPVRQLTDLGSPSVMKGSRRALAVRSDNGNVTIPNGHMELRYRQRAITDLHRSPHHQSTIRTMDGINNSCF